MKSSAAVPCPSTFNSPLPALWPLLVLPPVAGTSRRAFGRIPSTLTRLHGMSSPTPSGACCEAGEVSQSSGQGVSAPPVLMEGRRTASV
nr:MAG: hypothetical protein [Sanya fiers-like virus 51]